MSRPLTSPARDSYIGEPQDREPRSAGLGNGSFEDVSRYAGADLQRTALYHGAAFADFDNDGRDGRGRHGAELAGAVVPQRQPGSGALAGAYDWPGQRAIATDWARGSR